MGAQKFRAALDRLIDQAHGDGVRSYLIADCLDAAATAVRVRDAATRPIL
jgi:hypothetical protein